MNTMASDNLRRLYEQRFSGKEEYRRKVWDILVSCYFYRFIPSGATVLDLGCGHGEFINHVNDAKRYAMDFNPGAAPHLDRDIHFFEHDSGSSWPLSDNCLDVVFTSNFFEHLPNKATLLTTMHEAYRCLAPGGRLIALGPNIKYVAGAYWDFWDHHIPLTDASLSEALETVGFTLQSVVPRFLPYTMSGGRDYPLFMLRLYLKMPLLWKLFGRQFLIVAKK